MLSVRCLSVCLSVLSVTLVYCGQTVQRIKMKLGMQVGLGPDNIVLGEDPAPLTQRDIAPIFSPYLLRPNACMDQDATRHGARPRPRRLCLDGDPALLPKKGAEPHPKFSAIVYCAKTAGRIKMVLGMEIGLSPVDFVLDGE